MRLTSEQEAILKSAAEMVRTVEAAGLMVFIDGPVDWERLKACTEDAYVIVASDSQDHLAGAAEAGLAVVEFDGSPVPVYDRLAQALIESIADELLKPGARVVAAYSGFEVGEIDSVSLIDTGDHLGRLTVRDLQKLESSVPLDTLQTVVNLALEIGREGREGKPVGALFVVGDSRRVLSHSRPTGFDPVKGYSRKERNLKSARVREGIKEICQMDGAVIIASDGTVEAAARYIDASASGITLSKGLGARHWAAAAISRCTKAVAAAVSESTGTVRLFLDGEAVLRIEPFRRPMKWKEFEFEPPVND